MPEMGGLEAAEIIRADTAITDQPRIVAVTANAFAEDRVKCLQVYFRNEMNCMLLSVCVCVFFFKKIISSLGRHG